MDYLTDPFNYYEQFIAASRSGGIDAVARTEHFAALIAANPRNRAILDAMGADGTYEGTYIGMLDHNATQISRALGGIAPEKGLNGQLGVNPHESKPGQ